ERAVVPGEPERSLLVKAINHVGDYQMPPKRKLADEQIAALTEWVKMGLPWPAPASANGLSADSKPSAAQLATIHRQTHWAYQPVVRPTMPPVKDEKWLRGRVDAFVLAKLEAAGLTPSPEADRRTL